MSTKDFDLDSFDSPADGFVDVEEDSFGEGSNPEDQVSEEEFFAKRDCGTHVYNITQPATPISIQYSAIPNHSCEFEDGYTKVEDVNAEATNDTTQKSIASLEAQVIYGEDWGARQFWFNMDAISESTLNLAQTVFDRYAKLKERFLEHGICKGTGAFSDPYLGSGTIAHIDIISIDMDVRRQGLGKRMVELLLEKFKAKGVDWVFAWPTELSDAQGTSRGDREIFDRNVEVAIRFWRSCGFRRVGNTHWFCYAMDPDHKSRMISADEDI